MLVQMNTKSGEIRFAKSSLLAIKIFEQCLHMSGLLEAGTKGVEMFIESYQAGLSSFLIATYESTNDALTA